MSLHTSIQFCNVCKYVTLIPLGSVYECMTHFSGSCIVYSFLVMTVPHYRTKCIAIGRLYKPEGAVVMTIEQTHFSC